MKQGDTGIKILLVLPGDKGAMQISVEDAKKLYEQLSEVFGAREPVGTAMIFGPSKPYHDPKNDPLPKLTDMIPPNVNWPPLVRPGDQWPTSAPPDVGPPSITCQEQLPEGCCYGEKQ